MTDVRRSIRLPPDLAARIDAARGFEPWSSWVKRTLEEALAPNPFSREAERKRQAAADVLGVVKASSLVCPRCRGAKKLRGVDGACPGCGGSGKA